jgi:hypothetical protein
VIVLNVHAPTEGKSGVIKDIFCEEILSGDFSPKVGKVFSNQQSGTSHKIANLNGI